MRPKIPREKDRINWDVVFLFLLLAIGLVAIGLIFYPVLLYLAGALLVIANLVLMARRRRRAKRDQDKEWIHTEDLF